MVIFLENDSNMKLSDLVRSWSRARLPHVLPASSGVLCPWPPATWWLTLWLRCQSSHRTVLASHRPHMSASQPHVPPSPPSELRSWDPLWERLSLSFLTNVTLWVASPKSFRWHSLTSAPASFFSIRFRGDILAMFLFIACFLMSI